MPIFKPINRTAYLVKPRYVPSAIPTRLYIDTSLVIPLIVPTADASWNTTSQARQAAKISINAPNSVYPLTANLSRPSPGGRSLGIQLITPPLVAGQTIRSQKLKAQFVCGRVEVPSTVRLSICVKIIASDGVTVRQTLQAITNSTNEINTSPTNVTIDKDMSFTNYTSQSGDRILVEIGTYSAGDGYNATIETGFNVASDLPIDEVTTTYNRPWIEFGGAIYFDLEYVTSSNLSTQSATISASATYSSPTRTATVALASQTSSIAASATFTKPTYTAGAALTAEPSTLEANASFYLPTRTATASLASQAASIAALVEVINNDSVQSSIWMQLNRILQEAKPLFSTFCDPQA